MKRKRVTRDDWKRVTCRKMYVVHRLDSKWARSFCSITMLEVTNPLYVEGEGEPDVCIVDKEYTWIQHVFPNTPYTITTMVNKQDEAVQWYIDVCKQVGWDEQQIPWYDDLYLDVVIYPGFTQPFLLDEDELDEALALGKITQEEHAFAWQVTRDLMDGFANGTLEPLLQRCYLDYVNWKQGKPLE